MRLVLIVFSLTLPFWVFAEGEQGQHPQVGGVPAAQVGFCIQFNNCEERVALKYQPIQNGGCPPDEPNGKFWEDISAKKSRCAP